MKADTVTGIGVVGLGVIARHYLAAIGNRGDATLRAVCDLNKAKLATFRSISRTTELSELLDREDVDAVIVNVPNDVHYEICSAALRASKHVCCEKPLVLQPRDADGLAALAALRGVRLFTAFHRRYNLNVSYLLARTRMRAPVRSVRVRYFERIEEHCGQDAWYLNPARCGGGTLADNGPNALDLLRLFLGDLRIERVFLERNTSSVDVRALLHVSAPETGATARVELDWAYAHGELKHIQVVTDDGLVDEVDMLAGFTGFKSSLAHEYTGILSDFLSIVGGGLATRTGPDGVVLTHLISHAYGIAKEVVGLRFEDAL